MISCMLPIILQKNSYQLKKSKFKHPFCHKITYRLVGNHEIILLILHGQCECRFTLRVYIKL